MALTNVMAMMPGGGVQVRYGQARWTGDMWVIDDGGNFLEAHWLDPIQPLQSGNLAYLLVNDGRGQSSALVLGGYTKQPRPSTGTILAFGEPSLILLAGEDGVTYTTSRFLGPRWNYAVGDNVYVTWDAAQPTVLGEVSEITVTPQAPAVQAPPARGGTEHLIATRSNTYGQYGWGTWAGSTNGREQVYTGTISGATVSGAWFYGEWGKALAGVNVTQLRFRVPARLPGTGASGAITIYLYAHTSSYQPGGEVARVAGPFAVELPAGYDPNTHKFHPNLEPGWVILPFEFHQHISNGGGIAVAGGGYTGLAGRLADGSSGQIDADWSAS